MIKCHLVNETMEAKHWPIASSRFECGCNMFIFNNCFYRRFNNHLWTVMTFALPLRVAGFIDVHS